MVRVPHIPPALIPSTRVASTVLLAATITVAASTSAASSPPEDVPGRVGSLANALAAAEARLVELHDEVARKLEDANRAQVDVDRAEDAAANAEAEARASSAESDAAIAHIEAQRKRLRTLIAASYQHGSEIGPLLAFANSRLPRQALHRAELLEALGASERVVLADLERARIVKANKDSAAARVMREADVRRSEAARARQRAQEAVDAAVAARAAQKERHDRLEGEKARARADLSSAQAAMAVPARPAMPDFVPDQVEADAPGDHAVELVVQRALSQVGVVYAWGGGDGSGPTGGIRDGGVADAHRDYDKIGFDCSGLMVYAFAGAGIRLDHYSGYQYESGRKVELADMRRGDLLFWQGNGSMHHVALYLGGGRMVEAPYSGERVRVTPVRYAGIAPFAVRLL